MDALAIVFCSDKGVCIASPATASTSSSSDMRLDKKVRIARPTQRPTKSSTASSTICAARLSWWTTELVDVMLGALAMA